MAKLNSKYAVVEASRHGADSLILLESRSGRKTGLGTRNPDYPKQLNRILRRLKKYECIIVRIEVVSTVAYQWDANRKLALRYPIHMSKIASTDRLRKDIQGAQRSLVQRPGARGGNTTKRIGIWIKVGSLVPTIGLSTILTEE